MRHANTILRLLVGGLFIGHGTQKLFGWFGGHGVEGTSGYMESLGLRPGRPHAIAAGVSEAGGGALLLAGGRATAAGGAAITGSMVMAIRHQHRENGLWSSDGGFEYNLVLIGAVLAVTEREAGPLLALLQLAAGAAGSLAMGEIARRAPELESEPEPERVEEVGRVVAPVPAGSR